MFVMDYNKNTKWKVTLRRAWWAIVEKYSRLPWNKAKRAALLRERMHWCMIFPWTPAMKERVGQIDRTLGNVSPYQYTPKQLEKINIGVQGIIDEILAKDKLTNT